MTAMGTEELEVQLGAALRGLRLAANITQAELARRANVDRTTVARIEHGEGGSIRSLIQVIRALEHEEWLDALMPASTSALSPMQLLRARQQAEASTRKRVRRSS